MEITMTERGDKTSGMFERTFVVSVPVERAWKAMTDPEELNKWYFPVRMAKDGSLETEIVGETRTSEVLEAIPERMFHTRTVLTGREGFGVMPGAREMTVVFEASDAGTRITITQSGFGEGEDWERDLTNAMRGLEETIADLVLYLETGVAFPRHLHGEKSFHGIAGREVRAGLEVRAVQPGTFADRLGLRAGDFLVELGGAAVFGIAELSFFTKEHGAGELASAAWVRGGELMRGSAELGTRPPVGPALAS